MITRKKNENDYQSEKTVILAKKLNEIEEAEDWGIGFMGKTCVLGASSGRDVRARLKQGTRQGRMTGCRKIHHSSG